MLSKNIFYIYTLINFNNFIAYAVENSIPKTVFSVFPSPYSHLFLRTLYKKQFKFVLKNHFITNAQKTVLNPKITKHALEVEKQ